MTTAQQEQERAELEYYLETLYNDHDTADYHEQQSINNEIEHVQRLLEEI